MTNNAVIDELNAYPIEGFKFYMVEWQCDMDMAYNPSILKNRVIVRADINSGMKDEISSAAWFQVAIEDFVGANNITDYILTADTIYNCEAEITFTSIA